MLAIISFFFNNIISITVLTIIIFAALAISSYVNKSDTIAEVSSNKKISKIVTIESFTNDDDDNDDDDDDDDDNDNDDDTELPDKPFNHAFCEHYKSEPHKIEEHCNNLKSRECNATNCCIFVNDAKCVAGDKRGPTYHGTKDKPIHTEYYQYKNTCYSGEGSCPS